ncbi:hypothetical protein BJ165DRAFT_1410260 [Panaeolus papilionaceus]|nr:hypothetical protein BJ165DRAFT_1410260 [Panaeolus papilionaceus]
MFFLSLTSCPYCSGKLAGPSWGITATCNMGDSQLGSEWRYLKPILPRKADGGMGAYPRITSVTYITTEPSIHLSRVQAKTERRPLAYSEECDAIGQTWKQNEILGVATTNWSKTGGNKWDTGNNSHMGEGEEMSNSLLQKALMLSKYASRATRLKKSGQPKFQSVRPGPLPTVALVLCYMPQKTNSRFEPGQKK